MGLYYLGLHRSEDGSKWNLVFIDPAKVRAEHIDAFDIHMAPVWFEVPVTFRKTEGGEADKLTIRFRSTFLLRRNSNLHEATGDP